ncbi:MAG: hypothetical protein IT372_34385, partial [Polyangiaceae bacterium]|nr:hypothetical protein [Polyangiaceae bacterium]
PHAPPAGASGTIVGQPAPGIPVAPEPARAPQPAARTLLGVARPGIAPLSPGLSPEPDPAGGAPGLAPHGAPSASNPEIEPPRDDPGYEPASELGATIAPRHFPWPPQPHPRAAHPHAQLQRVPRAQPRPAASPRAEPRPPRRAIALMIAAGALAAGAVLFVLLWPDAPPVTARARADAGGREVLELRCDTCPDGTVVSVGEGRATTARGVAQIPLAAPLSVGDNRMKVSIDRPGSGRDETIAVSAAVAYRIRPDLATLDAETPSLQILVEAMAGTEVSLDGKPLPLAGGRAALAIDVADAVTGPADEARTLSRQIPYDVRPAEGPREQGVVSVSIGVVPLRIDAPGASVVIDKESFVLEGRTAKGAKIFAGAHPIPVRPDGTFAHVMNVSSIGATRFEVRARMEGMAPRIARIAVRRVDRLETAARDFAAQGPIGWGEIAASSKEHAGKPIVLSGEVLEARQQGHATVILLSVAPASGCRAAEAEGCKVRLVQGTQSPARRGDALTAYGRVGPPFAPPGGGQEIPEIEVEFSLVKGAR